MSRLDIDALRTLCAVADHGGITRAAENLPLSQSAVSHKIKRLEDNIGCPLLARKSGGPLLTKDGARLLYYARRLCALHDEALQSLSKQPLSGSIRLGMTEDVTSSDLSLILGRFTRLHPDVSVRTHVKQSTILQQELARGEIDMSMMQIFAAEMKSSDILLFRDSLHWVKAKDMELNQGQSIPFLAYDDDCFFKHWAMDDSNLPASGLETVLQCASSAGIASAVRAGLGVSLLPGRYLTDEMQVLDDSFPPTPGLCYILRLGRNAKSRHIQSLADEIAKGVKPQIELQVVG